MSTLETCSTTWGTFPTCPFFLPVYDQLGQPPPHLTSSRLLLSGRRNMNAFQKWTRSQPSLLGSGRLTLSLTTTPQRFGHLVAPRLPERFQFLDFVRMLGGEVVGFADVVL